DRVLQQHLAVRPGQGALPACPPGHAPRPARPRCRVAALPPARGRPRDRRLPGASQRVRVPAPAVVPPHAAVPAVRAARHGGAVARGHPPGPRRRLTPFLDRADAGRALAHRIVQAAIEPTVVLGLARGGVPVAAEVATALGAPLDVFVVRKLGVPGHRELAMGAVATGGVRVLNERVVASLSIPAAAIDAVAADEERELARREAAYRSGRAPLDLLGADVLLVDDGLATGATMHAAIEAARIHRPHSISVGVPVGARTTCEELAALADAVVCVETPANFSAVG